MVSPLIVALDFPTLDRARTMAETLSEEVAGFKVGLELLMAEGPAAIESIASLGLPVFADAKLHDIPNTVAGAARRLCDAGARWVTVHAPGGVEMMRAAMSAMGDGGVLAVTVLTSLDGPDLAASGVASSLEDQIVLLAANAEMTGVEGIVCAPGDITAVRARGIELKIFAPGIRPETWGSHDQKRVGTPRAAIEAGADYLVVGRPITESSDPVEAAREIARSSSSYA
jgi:orotidine-5'-phosphate decarboxylase